MGSARAAFALGVTLVAAYATTARSARAASDEDRAAARTAATACLRAFNDGRFQEAVDLCTRAEALMHAPTHLLLIARAQTKLGHLVEAQEAYFRIERDTLPANAPKAFIEAQASAKDEQAALAPRIPTIKIALDGVPAKDVTLTIDGQGESAAVVGLPKPVNPGQHTLSARGSNAESETVTVTVPEGAARDVNLTMHALANASPQPLPASPAQGAPQGTDHAEVEGGGQGGLRLAGWIGVGAGVVGAALGTLFVVENHSDLNDANALCGGAGCPLSKKGQIDDYDSKASTDSALAWVSYGVGVAAAGAGVVMLVMGRGKGAPGPQSAGLGGVRPWVGPGSAGMTIAW